MNEILGPKLPAGLTGVNEAAIVEPIQLEPNGLAAATAEVKRPSLYDHALTGLAVASAAFQQSPGNEAVRAYVGLDILRDTHNPVLAAAGVGAATLVIEGVSSLAIAAGLNSPNSSMRKILRKVRGRIYKGRDGADIESNALSDAGAMLAIGAGAIVVKRHIQESDRTFEKDKKTIAKAAGTIAIFSATIAGLAGGGIETASSTGIGKGPTEFFVEHATDWKTYAGLVVLAQGANLTKRLFKRPDHREAAPTEKLRHYNEVFKYTSSLLTPGIDDEAIARARQLVAKVWDKKNYGSENLKDYEKYHNQSNVFASFDKTGKCIGVIEVFKGSPEAQPFMDLEISDNALKERLEAQAKDGTLEELAITAVGDEAPFGEVALDLWRLAYRDGVNRGVKTWGIIMEPRRVRAMNIWHGFSFKQIGPKVLYQGGDCAPHIQEFDDVARNMSTKKPGRYEWFVHEPLKSEE